MLKHQQKTRVLIGAKSPRLQKMLAEHLANYTGNSSVVNIASQTNDGILVLPSDDLTGIIGILDIQILSVETIEKLQNFERIIVFNLDYGSKKLVDYLNHPNTKLTSILLLERDFLTPEVFDEKYSHEIRPDDLHDNDLLPRVSSAASPAQLVQEKVFNTSNHLDSFLQFLTARLHDSPDLRNGIFSEVPSKIQIPKSQWALTERPSDFAAVKRRIFSHATVKENALSGLFVLGKRGTGKSTVSAHVGNELHQKGKVFFATVDYTLVLARQFPLNQLRILMREAVKSFINEGISKDFGEKYSHAWAVDLKPHLEKCIENDDYSVIKQITPESLDILETESDRAFLLCMYSFFKDSLPSKVNRLYLKSSEITSLYPKAEQWYANLSRNPKRLFVFYLYYTLHAELNENIDRFSYMSLIISLLRQVRQLQVSSIKQEEIQKEIAISISKTCQIHHHLVNRFFQGEELSLLDSLEEQSILNLGKITRGLIKIVTDDRPLLLLLDNIDQRPSQELEALVVSIVTRWFQEDIMLANQKSRALLAMRETTYQSEKWIQMRTKWSAIELQPADLTSILRKRFNSWQLKEKNISQSRAPQIISRASALIGHWEDERLLSIRDPHDASDNTKRLRERNLIDIVEHRFPFNVGDQLECFADCIRGPLLQSALLSKEDSSTWTSRSFEFYVRTFVIGNENFWNKQSGIVPNLYDAGDPSSKFNAVILSWMLWEWDDAETSLDKDQVISFFRDRGVSSSVAESAIQTLLQSHILRWKSGQEDHLVLSVWGNYFRSHIAYNLPYISSVWWQTPMGRRFSLGEPFVPVASELHDLSSNFLRWIRAEESFALSNLSLSSVPPWRPEAEDWQPQLIFTRVNTEVLWSLHKLDRHLSQKFGIANSQDGNEE